MLTRKGAAESAAPSAYGSRGGFGRPSTRNFDVPHPRAFLKRLPAPLPRPLRLDVHPQRGRVVVVHEYERLAHLQPIERREHRRRLARRRQRANIQGIGRRCGHKIAGWRIPQQATYEHKRPGSIRSGPGTPGPLVSFGILLRYATSTPPLSRRLRRSSLPPHGSFPLRHRVGNGGPFVLWGAECRGTGRTD